MNNLIKSKDTNSDLITFFPTTVLRLNLNRPFTNEEITVIEKDFENKSLNSSGNWFGYDSYILDSLPMLKEFCKVGLTRYLKEVIISDVDIDITQSWLNWTFEGSSHHRHSHPNSYLSGVLYLETTEDDFICFGKSHTDEIVVDSKENNYFNANTWELPVKQGDLIIFRSNVEHFVKEKQQVGRRTSLAFNSMPNGSIGSRVNKTELNIKGGTYE